MVIVCNSSAKGARVVYLDLVITYECLTRVNRMNPTTILRMVMVLLGMTTLTESELGDL